MVAATSRRCSATELRILKCIHLDLGIVLFQEGHSAEAEKILRETVDTERRVFGTEDPGTVKAVINLTTTLSSLGRYGDAEKLEREALDMSRRVLGPEHRYTMLLMEGLGYTLLSAGRYAEAQNVIRETHAIQRRVLGPEHPDTALSVYNLAGIASHSGKPDEALSLLQAAVDHGLAPDVALTIEKDDDFKSLHGDPRFETLVAHARERTGATKQNR
jgi:tetratricopeptide (TPR) repeat protein